jgi:hypothetical protein
VGAVDELARGLSEGAESAWGRRAIGTWSGVVQIATRGGETCHLVVAEGSLDARAGTHIHPTCRIEGDEDALVRALGGEIDLTHLLANGNATISGNYYDMINLGRVIMASRRRSKKP